MTNESKPPALVLDQPTPTLFVDYDGTLHRGHGLLDEQGNVSLDSGEPAFEYAPLLASMLEPYPDVEIVLTTRWLQKLSFEQVVSFLPAALAAYFGERDRRFRERDRFGGFGRCAVSIVDFLVSAGRVRAPRRWV